MQSIVIFGSTLFLLAATQPWTISGESSKEKDFYASTSTKVNWIAAQHMCSSKGMTLVSINTKAESESLLKYLEKNDFTKADGAFWTSGSRQGDNSTWVWFSNGRSFQYTNWRQNEPNNRDGMNEECVVMLPNGEWNDLVCKEERYIICENRCLR